MHVACPSCSKNFKVTAAALGQAKGLVRCGSCKHIFNALPLLIDDPIPLPSIVPAMTPAMAGVPGIAIPVPNVIAPPKEEPKPQSEPEQKKKFRFLNKEVTVLLAAAALSPAIVKLIEMIPPPKPGATVESTVVETPVPVLLQPGPTKPVAPAGKSRTITTNSDPVINLIRETIPKELRVESSTSEDKPIQFGNATVDQNGDQPVITFDNRSPEELLAEARTLLLNRNGSYDKAIEDLKAIILTQPHDKAREAHEVLGYAYEKSKLIDKAMLEYQRYLALYPEDNEDRTRVRQRLMTLEILDPDGGRPRMAGVITSKEPRKGDSFDFHGNFSDYFYSSFSAGMKQYEMLSAGNFIMKLQHNQYDLTSKVRFSKVNDFSNTSSNKTTISNAYVDLQDTFKGYGIRLGRQPSQAGAISRFDGVSANAPINNDVKLTVAAGTPYIGPNQKTTRKFQGAEVDWNVNRDWVLGAYVNRETADDFLERMAVGTNVQYFDKNTNLLVRTEYDTVYHSLNMVTVQAMKYVGAYDFFLVYDRRKSPMPYGDVALGLGLLGPSKEVYNSVGDIFNKSGLTPSDIYTYISNTTPVASALVLGANKKLNKDWTATVNVQSTNISTTPGFNVAPQFNPVPLQVGEKNTYSFNAHLKGDNVLTTNNTVEFVANKGIGATKSFYVTGADEYRFGEKKQNSLSLILRYDNYLQNLIYTHNTTGILRGFYEIGENKMFEAQISRTLSVTDPIKEPAQSNTNTTFYIGFRYDF